MKFKQQNKQNQLIEKITSAHLVIGIDIAQETHVARAVNYRGIILGQPLTFANDEAGFQQLLNWIEQLQNEKQLSATIIGMEPTGHYWKNLATWLSKEHGLEVVLVNPYLVKKNKENRDNTPSKSDKKDALVIADMIKNGYYSFVRQNPQSFEELRVLMSSRDAVTRRLVSAANQLHRWIDIVFPEYRQVFRDITCPSSLITLRLFPIPDELRKKQPQEIVNGWKTKIKRHPGLKRAQTLITQAIRSVGKKEALNAYRLHLEQLLDEYDLASAQLQTIEQQVQEVLQQIPFAKKMLDMKGLSIITVAGILAESGDLSGFAHGNALLRHAGLNLSEASSGKWKGQIVISKRGRARLRRFLFLAAKSLCVNHPDFRDMHLHNVETKKMKRIRSILKLCGKLARVLVGMARSGQPYTTQKATPIMQAA